MLRQAVQTLTGRAGDPATNDGQYEDVFELGQSRQQDPETNVDQAGPTDEQHGNDDLRATVERLSQNFQTLNERMSAKDRYIGQLEGENQTLRSGVAPLDTGRQPEPEPDPVLDKATAALWAEKYKENPEEALVVLAEHMDGRSQARLDQSNQQTQEAQAVASRLNAIERNLLRQVDLARANYGEAADAVVGDFVNLVRQGNASAHDYSRTWLGSELAADRPLAETTQGVYRLIELEILRNRAKQTGQQEPDTETYQQPQAAGGQTSGIRRPTAPSRTITTPSDGSAEAPLEDRIGDAIVNAAKGDDEAIRTLFQG
jgi:hypothetical protein